MAATGRGMHLPRLSALSCAPKIQWIGQIGPKNGVGRGFSVKPLQANSQCSLIGAKNIAGTLTILKMQKVEGERLRFFVQCKCGEKKSILPGHFMNAKSCGCMKSELIRNARTIHGHSNIGKGKRSPEYLSWKSMRERCYYKKHKSYADYGGRGIGVCKEWLDSYVAFLRDMGQRPKKHQLERIDNSLGYFKENCEWALPSKNANNRRSSRVIEFRGERLTLCQWARKVGVYEDTLGKRLECGWPLEKALQPTLRFTSASRPKLIGATLP